MPADRAPAAWIAITAALLGCLVLALTITPITNNDLFLHLKTGERILAEGRVPMVDDYSALARGRPFTAHEWLAGVVFQVVRAAGGRHGFDALILMKSVVALCVAAMLLGAATLRGARPTMALPCLALVLILAAARFLERPHIFGYLLTAAYLLVLSRHDRRAAAGGAPWASTIVVLAILQIAWTNLHGSFLLGPAIVSMHAAAALLDGWRGRPGRSGEGLRLMGLAALLGAACLVNPYGVRLLQFPFTLTESRFMGQIYEWLPPYTSPFRTTYMARLYLVWAIFGAGVVLLGMLRSRRGEGSPSGSLPFVIFAAFFALSLRMNRNVTDFALATFPVVAAEASRVLPPRRSQRALVPSIALALLGLIVYFSWFGYAFSPSGRRMPGFGLGRNIPVAAADYLERNRIAGNAFNSYSSGAYLIQRFYPEVHVAMDSRNDVYGEALFEEYQRALTDPASLETMLRGLDASFIFLDWPQAGTGSTAAAVHAVAGGWRPVYFDDAAVVYLAAAGPYAALVSRDAYELLDPALFRPGGFTPPVAEAALAESERAVRQSGDAYIARVMRVDALLTLGRSAEAAREEARIVQEDPPLAHIQTLLGLAHLVRGDRVAATARLRRALALNPYSGAARQALHEAEADR
jgi:hypothetical protein